MSRFDHALCRDMAKRSVEMIGIRKKLFSAFAKALIIGITFFLLSGCSAESSYARVPWNKAKEHVGERVTVIGAVVSTRYASSSRGQPTFLNIGNEYPDSNRFTIVIWGDSRDAFDEAPEAYYEGKKIEVTGEIGEYEGVPQIEAGSPDQIEVY